MKKSKQIEKRFGILPERLAKLKRTTLIAFAGSSLRISGSKITVEQVEQIMSALNKPSEQEQEHQTS